MVYVRLAQEWTDPQGVRHPVGAVIRMDESTAAELKELGIAGWVGPTAPPENGQDADMAWPGATSTQS